MPVPDYRAPATLRRRRSQGGPCYVAAQMLYMSGIDPRPNAAAIDRAVGRQPNAFVDTHKLYYFLLQSGMEARVISAFDDDRFLQEGIDYLREYYKVWHPQWDAYYTPEWFETGRRLAEQHRALRRHERIELRVPTVGDVTRLLRQGWFVTLALGAEGDSVVGSLLVYGRTDTKFKVYSPDMNPTLLTWNTPTLQHHWLRSEGLVAYRRRA